MLQMLFNEFSIAMLYSLNTKNQRMKDVLQATCSAQSLKECKTLPISLCSQKSLHRNPNLKKIKKFKKLRKKPKTNKNK